MSVAMVNGNKKLASASEEGITRIWEVESGSVAQVFGHERGGTVSHLLVANVFGSGRKKDEVTKCSGTSSQGFCEGEIIRKVRDAEEMEGWLGVVVKDRRRATDMLEVIIGTYGRLL